MWFGFEGENTWHPIPVERVKEILLMNEKGEIPETLQVDKDFDKIEKAQALTNDLERLDRKYKKKPKPKRKNKNQHSKNPQQKNAVQRKTEASAQKENSNRNSNRKFRNRKNKK